MRASSPRKRGLRGWCRVQIADADLGAMGKLIREAGPCLAEGDPVRSHAYYDNARRPRRIHAQFADGWRATLVLHVGGTCSLSWALKLKGEIKGPLS